MLDAKRIERNRIRLEDQRARLQTQLNSTASTMDEQERPGYSTHMAEQASEVFEQAKSLAVRQQLRRTLEEVNRALEKMDQGTYGICEACGGQIDPARLKALPHALLCMTCQARAERIVRR